MVGRLVVRLFGRLEREGLGCKKVNRPWGWDLGRGDLLGGADDGCW